MNTSDIIISLIIFAGIGWILTIIFRDPIYMFKLFLRGLKADGNPRVKILLFPIWGTIWLIDKTFGFNLYIKNWEDASSSYKISLGDYNKFILIHNAKLKDIEKNIHSLKNEYDPIEYNYKINNCKIKIANWEKNIVLKLENEINFKSFNHLVHYLDNSAPQGTNYNVYGILFNKQKRQSSFFIFQDSSFPLKLIGKTETNKKIYVDLNPETEQNDTIYSNSNMDYFKNLDFKKYMNEFLDLKFMELPL